MVIIDIFDGPCNYAAWKPLKDLIHLLRASHFFMKVVSNSSRVCWWTSFLARQIPVAIFNLKRVIADCLPVDEPLMAETFINRQPGLR